MFLTDLANSGPIPVLEKLAAFTEARQRMLAENIANIDNPEYRAKQLDPKTFQESLRKALHARRENPTSGFVLKGTDEIRQDEQGHLVVNPSEVPAENVLFHDHTNARVERQMAAMAENTMMHQAAIELLRSRFEGLKAAIRGQS
ncbi:MAG: flagellar basal body rod protein FlgB [Phycisphaerae bacterium]|nr:flagellar basal body rod protein FlgB [Phycisphaerae bacterium]